MAALSACLCVPRDLSGKNSGVAENPLDKPAIDTYTNVHYL
jgi:hypothetical protein